MSSYTKPGNHQIVKLVLVVLVIWALLLAYYSRLDNNENNMGGSYVAVSKMNRAMPKLYEATYFVAPIAGLVALYCLEQEVSTESTENKIPGLDGGMRQAVAPSNYSNTQQYR
jgi:hypothetical protein